MAKIYLIVRRLSDQVWVITAIKPIEVNVCDVVLNGNLQCIIHRAYSFLVIMAGWLF
jgi:hypothetical protein